MDKAATDALYQTIRFEDVNALQTKLEELKASGIDMTEMLFTAVDKTEYMDEPLPLHAVCTRNDDDGERSERALLLAKYIAPERLQEMLELRAGAFKRTPLMHACGKFDAKLVAALVGLLDDPVKHFQMKDVLGYNPFMMAWNNNNSQYDACVILYQVAAKHGVQEDLIADLDEGNKRMLMRDILPAEDEDENGDIQEDIATSGTVPTDASISASQNEKDRRSSVGGVPTPQRKKSAEPPQHLPPSGLGPQHFDFRNQVEYEARAKELQQNHEDYVGQHPELQQLLHDLMQSILFHKPQDPLQFIGDHFRNHYTTTQ